MRLLSEHELFSEDSDCRYNNLRLVSWTQHPLSGKWAYYASYIIGAEWIDNEEALVVTPKRGVENIDFLEMFMTCFSSDVDVDSFSRIYSVELDGKPIASPALAGVLSPLVILHFLGVLQRIKTLKKDYVTVERNIKKVKGHIKILKNERVNVAFKRFDRIHCEFDEYTEDIPENRILKKALLYSRQVLSMMGKNHQSYAKIAQIISRSLAMFANVGDEVIINEVGESRVHKLYKDYREAIRLAKVVSGFYDYSINRKAECLNMVIPFTIDMSLLYEHYVYGLLYEAYRKDIDYQYQGKTGFPDFLFRSEKFRAILDTKYIPKYSGQPVETYIIRQLSAYARDLKILRRLGYEDIDESCMLPAVPCVIIYPIEDSGYMRRNPFLDHDLESLLVKEKGLVRFYKISLLVPMIR